MENFKFKDLKDLISESENRLISIYLPTFKKGTEVNKSRIQLKNLLKEAEEKLTNKGMNKREVDSFLEPAHKLLDETIFWQNQEESLALFISEKKFKYFKLPINVLPIVVSSDVYYIRPLLKLTTSYVNFNVLTLSQDEIKLYKCNQYSIEEIKVPEIDELVDDYIPIVELNRESNSPKGAASSGVGPGIHGYNEISRTEENDISSYLKKIDKEVNKVLKDEKNPLIIYSVDYIYPMYKELSSYGNILDSSIKGSPLEVNPKDIHSKAMSIFSKVLDGNYNKEVERFNKITNTNPELTSIELEDVVKEAYKGSIETLFVSYDVQVWGKFDEENFKVEILESESEGARDLLDYAALTTLENGGKVYIFDRVQIPEIKSLAAVLRY
jgi:hypothetical protein